MSALGHSVELLVVLLVFSWLVVMGGTGAAIAGIRGAQPWIGFLIAAAIPIPGVGWLVVWLVSSRGGGPTRTTHDSAEVIDIPLGSGW